MICVIAPSGEHVCSIATDCPLETKELKRRIEQLEGTSVVRQTLLQGRSLRDHDTIQMLDGSAVVTLERGPRFELVKIVSASGAALVVDEAGAIVRGAPPWSVAAVARAPGTASTAATSSASSVPAATDAFWWRVVEVGLKEFHVQVHEGPFAGKFAVAKGNSPTSPKSALVLADFPEAFTFQMKDVDIFGKSKWIHHEPVALAFMSKRRFAGVGGLFWHDSGQYFCLAQRAGNDFCIEESFCVRNDAGCVPSALL